MSNTNDLSLFDKCVAAHSEYERRRGERSRELLARIEDSVLRAASEGRRTCEILVDPANAEATNAAVDLFKKEHGNSFTIVIVRGAGFKGESKIRVGWEPSK